MEWQPLAHQCAYLYREKISISGKSSDVQCILGALATLHRPSSASPISVCVDNTQSRMKIAQKFLTTNDMKEGNKKGNKKNFIPRSFPSFQFPIFFIRQKGNVEKILCKFPNGG
jgi:hypothetical protein